MTINDIINKCNLNETELQQFSDYCMNKYENAGSDNSSSDIDFLSIWDSIISCAESSGPDEALNTSFTARYPVKLAEPEKVRIEIYDSFAGKIPIIYVDNVQDFEQIITNIIHKGVRPDSIAKTGASFISGKTIRFIVLSSKPYSNVTAEEVGVDPEEWRQKSMLIRRAHECTHFFTKQNFGMAFNNLHDELMADFMGVYDAFDFYRADWFLRFIGVIEGSGNRIDVYTENLSPKAKEAVIATAREAAYQLERWSETPRFKSMSYDEMIRAMCKVGIKGIVEAELPV